MSCPMCSKQPDQKYRPFCSKRCADLDLGKWMSGQYAVASQNEDDADVLLEELEKARSADVDADPSKLH